MKNILRRSLSWLLILVMVLGLVPQTPVFATDETLAPPVELEEAAPVVEEVPEVTPEETAEPEPEVPAPVEEPAEEVPEEIPEEAAENELMATSGTCGDNLTWTLASGVLTISGTGTMTDYRSYSRVPWYSSCSSINAVVIEKGVTSIGGFAFYNCSSLASITIPDSVTSIGKSAFSDCSSLTSVTIPDSVTSIGDYAFYYCSSLISITIPDSVTSIGDYAFYYCSSLTSVTIPDGVTSIGYRTFDYCRKLISITIPDSVTSIGYYAFECCSSLTSITIPDSVTSIGQYAFSHCSSLTSVTIPDGVTSIGDYAFYCCSSLTSVTIESGSIGDYAFYYCKSLTSVTIGSGVTSIGDFAFSDCSSLTSVTIGSGVTSIGDYAFYYCSSLTNIAIPDSVTSISDYAFYCCKSLTSVTIGSGVTSIGFEAFYCCKSLTSVTIGSGVTFIDLEAFYGCSSLTNITIPDNVISIDEWAFAACRKLSSVTFCGDAPEMHENLFVGVTANIYYPAGNTTWTEDIMQDYGGTLTWVPYITAPAKPHKITNVVSGVHVYWTAMDGISKYGLWRSETGKNGTYKWVANPTVPHFTDTKVESGKTYYYKVSAINPITGEHSDMSEAISVIYVGTPDLTLRVNRAVGIGLRWNAIEGATGYAIYRKSYSGTDAWKRIATITSGSTLAWDDTSVKNNNGEIYRYTIRALAGSNRSTLSGCRNTGRTMVRLTSQTLSSATAASANSIKCTWTKNAQATGYEVRFMVGSTVYKTETIGNPNTITKTINKLASGKTYKIQVRSYKKVEGVGSFYSAWSTAKNVKLG